MIDERTRTQLGRFLVVGILATCADAGTYFTAYSAFVPEGLAWRYEISKALAFLVGTTVAFVLNKHWTFEASGADRRTTYAFVMLYSLAFVVNVGGNSAALALLFGAGVPETVAPPVAFVVATGCSTVMNFIGQKLWVFRDPVVVGSDEAEGPVVR